MGVPRARRPPRRVAGLRRRPDVDRADRDLLRRAATLLRADANRAGAVAQRDARALAALLDIVAAALPDLDPVIRRQAVQSCRLLLGEPAPQPSLRRPRHR